MSTTQESIHQNICENMTHIQEDLEVLWNKVFEQVRSDIQVEKQAEYTQALEGMKQVINRYKSKYCPYIYKEKYSDEPSSDFTAR